MQTFQCTCGNTLHFENTKCLACGKPLGFLPDYRTLSPLAQLDDGRWRALHELAGGGTYRMCGNYAKEHVCNWMVPNDDSHERCTSCRLNHIIPDLADPKNHRLWARIERAKRRLVYTLLELGLPVIGKEDDPAQGLAFRFLADPDTTTEFADPVNQHARVLTGHDAGTITINLSEAVPSAREEMRELLNEQYRTLLGHFRHEIGHYYWSRTVEPTAWLDTMRNAFGDERADYAQALERYYAEGPPPDWSQHYISAYASAHPWEDWAETWAHYLHMIDTLETAHAFGFSLAGRRVGAPKAAIVGRAQYTQGPFARNVTFDALLEDWVNLTVAMNALNRSMGLRDAYPFALSTAASEKLRLVHELIRQTVTPA